MISYKVESDAKTALRKFSHLPIDVEQINRKILGRYGETVVATAKDRYLQAPQSDTAHLHRRSGYLSDSFGYRLTGRWGMVVGVIRYDVIYAAIHEFGGTIVPKFKDWLVFRTRDGGWVRTKKVVMPARPYGKPALDDLFKTGKAVRIGMLTMREEFRRRQLA